MRESSNQAHTFWLARTVANCLNNVFIHFQISPSGLCTGELWVKFTRLNFTTAAESLPAATSLGFYFSFHTLKNASRFLQLCRKCHITFFFPILQANELQAFSRSFQNLKFWTEQIPKISGELGNVWRRRIFASYFDFLVFVKWVIVRLDAKKHIFNRFKLWIILISLRDVFVIKYISFFHFI